MNSRLREALRCVYVGGHYRHYKQNTTYVVLGVALAESSGEPLVIYRTRGSDWQTWARPLREFHAFVDVNGRKVPRFRYTGRQLRCALRGLNPRKWLE